MTSIAPHITAFLRERLPLERQSSEHTCDSYAYAFQLLFEFARTTLKTSPSALDLEQFDASFIARFLEHLERDRGNSPRTRNARLAAIKSFMRFLEYRVPSAVDQVRRVMAIPFKRYEKRLIGHLTSEEIQALLTAPDADTRQGIRDRAMLYVCYAGGLRVSELVGLRMEDLTFIPRLSILVRGKGRRERALPLWKEAGTALRAWLTLRQDPKAPEVFLNARGGPMTRSGFEYILAKHVKAAGAKCASLAKKRVSPHVLRHTCAMTTLRATGDLRKVALWLGHASIQTTEIYTNADPDSKLAIVDLITPPHLRKGHFRIPDKLIAMLKDKRPYGGVRSCRP